MVAPFSKFYNKIWVGFCLNTGKRFFVELSLKANERASACFYVTISGNFERLQYLTLKQTIWKIKTFF